MLQNPLPEGVQVDGEVRLCLEADLHPDGSFGQEWLVVTDAQLLVFGKNGAGLQPRYTLPLTEISEPKSANFVGGGAFEVLHNGERMELLRYTNSRMPSFAAAAGLVEKWAKGEEAVIPEEEVKRCPTCGFPLELGFENLPGLHAERPHVAALARLSQPCWPSALGLMLLSLVSLALSLVTPYLQTPLLDNVLRPVGIAKPLR